MAEYCLRWNNHQPNLVTVFSELLNAESLVDVTLATDGHFIHAHKLVLSACSVYFKDLFGSNPCKHPIVFLKDIRIEDLKTVIDFIYRGEVNVAQERLQDVLKTAESLRIKGLADKPFNYEDYPSQRSGQHLSSSFSSQRSSLTDSREQQQSAENEDLADGSASSPPVSKKRKVASTQDSSESVQDTNHDNDEQQRTESKESPQKKLGSSTTPSSEDITNKSISSSCSLSIKEKIKEEEEGSEHTSDSRPEYQENQFALLQSRAADAMLLLQRSSSEGGGDEGGSTTPVPPTSNTRDSTSNLISSHTQGKSKRGMLQRQPGITREVIAEEQPQPPGLDSSPDYIVPDSISLTLNTESLSTTNVSWPESPPMTLSSPSFKSGNSSKMLQVPTVVVGAHLDKPHSYSPFGSSVQKHLIHSKPLLMVPSTCCASAAQITKQRSQPEMSRSHSEGVVHPGIRKQPSQPSVFTHNVLTSSPPDHPAPSYSDSSQQMALIPMQLIKKQRSSPGSLTSTPSHLRPIQPKPHGSEKELPIIQFTPSDEGSSYVARFPRAISEEPTMGRSLDLLSVGTTAPLTQSVSQDTGLDGNLTFMNRILSSGCQSVSVPKLSTNVSSTDSSNVPHHTPVLRDGPALGCNYCWNSQDNHGRVQRRKTKYHCPACRTNLCIVPCFHEYHNQMQMQQDQNKQFAKVLTKTSST